MPRSAARKPLHDASVVITRPVGQGRALVRKVRALGGRPVLLPGVSLVAAGPAERQRAALLAALRGDLVLFTSPSAVRFAARTARLRGHARFASVGRATARALRRHGVRDVLVPELRQDSEGLLAHSALAAVKDWRIAVIGAPGGRGVLQRTLRARGARVTDVWVYRRVPARLDARHRRALRKLAVRRCVLLSSVQTLSHLQEALADADWQRLTTALAVVSSERVEAAARAAGFARIARARSALDDALLAQALVALDTA